MVANREVPEGAVSLSAMLCVACLVSIHSTGVSQSLPGHGSRSWRAWMSPPRDLHSGGARNNTEGLLALRRRESN